MSEDYPSHVVKPEYYQNKTPHLKPDTCMTCKWVRLSGPHIGCYKNYTFQGWLPKRFAIDNKCPDYCKLALQEEEGFETKSKNTRRNNTSGLQNGKGY